MTINSRANPHLLLLTLYSHHTTIPIDPLPSALTFPLSCPLPLPLPPECKSRSIFFSSSSHLILHTTSGLLREAPDPRSPVFNLQSWTLLAPPPLLSQTGAQNHPLTLPLPRPSLVSALVLHHLALVSAFPPLAPIRPPTPGTPPSPLRSCRSRPFLLTGPVLWNSERRFRARCQPQQWKLFRKSDQAPWRTCRAY